MFAPSKYYNLTKRKFGNTQDFEKEREAFENELAEFTNFNHSPEFIRLKELNAWFEAKEHEKIKKQLAALTYKSSEEYKLENEFLKIEKNSTFKDYIKHTKSGIPTFFETVKNSGKVEELTELERFVNSSEYKKNRKEYKKGNTEEYQKEIRYNTLREDTDLSKYKKLQKDKSLQNYFQILNSSTLNRYNELKGIIESTEFIEKKKYLQSNDKFQKSEAFAMLEERKRLQKSAKILWYEKTLKSNKFKGIDNWKIAFEDNFDISELNESKWLSKFFWGDKLINSSYSYSNNLQNYTNNNIEISNGSLKIITKKETSQGLAWDTKYGFIPKSFDYTSGTINTGKTYRQSSGRIEAKVKMNCTQGVYHAMYLVGDKMLPQIDVFHKLDSNPTTIEAGYYIQKGNKINKSLKTIKNVDLDNNSYIFTIEWDSKKIYWAINGSIYKTEKNITANIPLYIVFASGVNGEADASKLPATMQIEWVKCWTKE